MDVAHKQGSASGAGLWRFSSACRVFPAPPVGVAVQVQNAETEH